MILDFLGKRCSRCGKRKWRNEKRKFFIEPLRKNIVSKAEMCDNCYEKTKVAMEKIK